jgi:UDP-glucose 4-epimerase
MRWLVTGGAGFIGAHIVEALVSDGNDVTVVDDLSGGSPTNVPMGVPLLRTDIRDQSLDRVFAEGDFEAVVHCAGQTAVSRSMEDPDRDFQVNAYGSRQVADLCRRHRVRRLMFLSSGGAIYGDTSAAANEETPPSPVSYYGIHKYVAERYIAASGAPHVIARLSNVYGPRQRTGLDGGVVAVLAERLRGGKPVQIFGSGEQTRDFIYVGDVVEALLALMAENRTGVWNVGSGMATSVNTLLRRLAREMDCPADVQHLPPRSGDVEHSCLDISKIVVTGVWRPRHSLMDGVRETLRREGALV